ncbi:MAG: DinB family protein [Isosphaeraceae bacterium]
MTAPDDLKSLHAFNRWADGRVVEALRTLSTEQYTREPAPGWPSVRSTFVHCADGASIWARRLRGESVTSRRTVADLPTLDDAERLLREGHEAFDRLLAETTPEALAAVWTYHNLQGQAASLPLWAVYRHVVNHATYHRGQIASKLRLLGFDPPVTDLVQWAIERSASPGD